MRKLQRPETAENNKMEAGEKHKRQDNTSQQSASGEKSPRLISFGKHQQRKSGSATLNRACGFSCDRSELPFSRSPVFPWKPETGLSRLTVSSQPLAL